MVEKIQTKISKWTVEALLRLRTPLDLIMSVDLVKDHIDVRSAMVLDIKPAEAVVVSQTSPPILKSQAGQTLEATFVTRDPVSAVVTRWGWRSRILDVQGTYRLSESDTETTPAVLISLEPDGALNETNVRMDYRLAVNSNEKVAIQTHPSFGRITLLDFSAGGALVSVPAPPQAVLGMKLWFTLFFSGSQQSAINGEAEVMRVTYQPGASSAKVGLKFFDLDLAASRALQKAINSYMLEEQRNRKRSHGE